MDVGTQQAGLELQDQLLPGVSRTFALTIPQLPAPLRDWVTNAYLLCRIADTIEDDPALSAEDKDLFQQRFIAVVGSADVDADALAQDLCPRLSSATPQAERELVARLACVVQVTRFLPAAARNAIERCVRIMSSGMADFHDKQSISGLANRREMERYCYVVAGIVGEMLTEMFCSHSRRIARHRERLMPLAVAFGQGLQMTNILKDFWEDRSRNSCWLPRDVFRRHGVDLADPELSGREGAFGGGLKELVGVAHACLRQAMDYVHLLPSRETGIRRFCIWAIGLAVLTLQNIQRSPTYGSGNEVKVSRPALRATMLSGRVMVRSNLALSALFNLISLGLPLEPAGAPQGAKSSASR